MRRPSPDQLFRHIGQLVIQWNDLDLQFRRLILALTEDELSVLVLIADYSSAELIRTTDRLAIDQDAFNARFDKRLKLISEKTGNHTPPSESIHPHIVELTQRADKLRVYRNYYAHSIVSPIGNDPHHSLGGVTARDGKGLHEFSAPIKLSEIRETTALIRRTLRYAQQLERCIASRRSSRQKPIPWPRPPAMVAALRKIKTPVNFPLPF
jgi:hypothetical protein